MQLKRIEQQVVAIVGASSGIGREAALRFAARGAKVVVAARSEPGLASLVNEIHQLGGDATAITADVSEYEQVKVIADKTVATYGRLDTWVHSSATAIVAPFEQVTPEEFKRVIDVTLMGQVYGAMVALPHLKREGQGALIHISSMEGRRALPLQSSYSSAKHGVEGFLESLRVELQHEGSAVSVTSIKPAVINTPFYNNALTKLGVKPTGLPPYYAPSLVTDAVLYTAEHPTRDFIVGDVGKILDILQRLSPALVDSFLVLAGFQGQQTNELKSADAPNNLYEPVPENDRVEGDFGNLTIPSVTDWLDRHPALGWGVAGSAVGAAFLALLAAQAFNSDH
ncbi:SDR family oxidoreductase [Stenomitos frigidus]|uniref:Short-chain dehydrogenase n=1 Tax=Stenomitos frigidus ULC18 TaxID=2107698 RepID=A0A2T1E1Q9_9CYAN|nr:SDR family oxidoreductase [Stenomitos frigidus]PSB26703.1 short-chain dehydrogenase [Stenomitos frigidus ULC18]